MNAVLELKGTFHRKSNLDGGGGAVLPKGASVSLTDLEQLRESLLQVRRYWDADQSGFRPLISIHYKTIIAKSNRMRGILSWDSPTPNETIVGATFSNDIKKSHIITHCMTRQSFTKGLQLLDSCMSVLKGLDPPDMTQKRISILASSKKSPLSREDARWKLQIEKLFKEHGLSNSRFRQIIKDTWYIDYFSVEEHTRTCTDSQIITLYNTGLSKAEILSKLGMDQEHINSIEETTWLVTPAQYNLIVRKAPFLISMAVTDLKNITTPLASTPLISEHTVSIPSVSHEPIIGVIDTLFDSSVYFNEWVTSIPMIPQEIIEPQDYEHGTAVSSILVDGPTLNPHMEDGCGRFRVRHFGVAKSGRSSSAAVLRTIQSVVETNKDIKVWNLSLGSDQEIEENFISPEASVLDRLQYEHDIIFVVAGTNNNNRRRSFPRIGAPADSLNSIVVNSIGLDGRPAEYSRSGKVLYFFDKPDVSVFGGDRLDPMIVHSSRGRIKTSGTSFAAPWVTRKLAYLIHVMGFSREISKALILDSAGGWQTDEKYRNLIGLGRVPTHIQDILRTEEDEIKCVVQGRIDAYEMYNYSVPVPRHNNAFPFFARATLCYFPKCSRSQGVDYTDSELDIHFGRLDREGKVKAINHNSQGEAGATGLFEHKVRSTYRKWDNVKHLKEKISPRSHARICLNKNSPNWGIRILTKERLEERSGQGLLFGLVITLKEMKGINRSEEFIQLCRANNWFIQEVNIENRINIYDQAEEEIILEDS